MRQVDGECGPTNRAPIETTHVYLSSINDLYNLYLLGAGTIERFDPRCNEWSICATMTGRRLQFGVAVLDEKLFIVGGRDGLKTLNSVECFNNKTNGWSSLPPVATHRHGLGKKPHILLYI